VSAGKHSKRRAKGHPVLEKQRKISSVAEDKEASLRKYRLLLKFLLPAAVFLWPFLYLFRHVLTINGQYAAIGNDFILLYYKYKVYLLASLAEFHFPLWSPAEGTGYPFYTNPFTQAFYPFNLLLVVWYKITGGYNPLDYQVFTVLGISIFALGLFMWLRLINSNIRAVIFTALIMSVSFKVTEMIRFPNAVHTAAWYPWILYALTRILFSKSLKDAAFGGVLLTFFLLCLFTGGYPYYVYYGLFLFPPYLLVFLLKPLCHRLLGPVPIHFKRALSTMILASGAALVICAPYFIGIKRLMAETIDRAGKDFNYSTAHIFNFEDTLGSLVYPPAASVEGWYFFSIAGLLLILLYMFTRNTINNEGKGKETLQPPRLSNIWVKLFFFTWICIISYISYGRYSYLFKLLWKFMPGFSSLRVWGRLNIILVPILAWLLSIAYASFESTLSSKETASPKKRLKESAPIIVLTTVYAIILIIQLYFYRNNIHDRLWAIYFEHVSEHTTKFLVYGAAAFIVIFLTLILSKRFNFKSNRALTVVLAVLVSVATIEVRHVGARVWTYQRQPEKRRIGLDVAKINQASFRMPRIERNDSISLTANFSVGVLPNWYFSRYNKFLKETEDDLETRRTLLGVLDGRKIFFSKSIEHSSVQAFLLDAASCQNTGQLLLYTGDELIWEIEAPGEGYLSFIDNWDQGWKVFVDDKETEMELLFGTFKSVRLTEGHHKVRFSYQPSLF
jgi:hypothetical protein